MRRTALFLSLLLCVACNRGDNVERSEAHSKVREPGERSKVNGEKDVITLSPEAISANGFRIVEVTTDSAWITTRVPGRVEFNENATAVAQPPLEGRLDAWRVNVGDQIKIGDEIARIANPQNLGTPVVLRTPLGGEVVERNGVLGDWVKPGDKLAVITDLSTVWVAVAVREDMVGKVRTDAPSAIRVQSFPAESFAGRFLRASSQVARETRTVEFLFEVPNAERKLRAGMFAYVSVAIDRIAGRLLVPDEAVQTIDGRATVFIAAGGGRFRKTAIQLGRKAGELYEVLGGLSSGEHVVADGSFVLKSEAARAAFAGEAD